MAEGRAGTGTIFISAARADRAMAAKVRSIFEGAGYRVILQQAHFSNRNFMQGMHAALASASRVVALLSQEYLASEYCTAEWQNTIAGDPLNYQRRLVLLRVTDVAPTGLLSALAYWDLVPVLQDPSLLADVVLDAVRDGSANHATVFGPYWRAPRTIVDPDVARPVSTFTGRERYMRAIDAELSRRRRPIVLHGRHGIGKTAIAAEYARRALRRYAVVWLLDGSSDGGIVDGFMRLGAELLPALAGTADRRATALYVCTKIIAQFSEPALLIFDKLKEEELLRTWAPASIAHTIVTSESSSWSNGVKAIAVEPWSLRTATAFLRRESNRSDVTAAEARVIAQRLDCTPLLVEQAAADLRGARNISARRYLERIGHDADPRSSGSRLDAVSVPALQLSIAHAEKTVPGAAAILCFASFLGAGAIPEELFRRPNAAIPPDLRPVVACIVETLDLRSVLLDRARTEDALAILHRLSLLTFYAEPRAFALVRLVHEAARRLAGNDSDVWARAAVSIVSDAFPRPGSQTEAVCESLRKPAQSALDALPREAASLAGSTLATRCGNYLLQRGKFAEAETFYRRALLMDELMYGQQHDDIGTDLNNLGEALRNRNRFGEAELCYRRALTVFEAVHGPGHTGAATVLNNLALLLNYTDRPAAAEAMYRESIAIEEKSGGRETASVARSLANLAFTLMELNLLDEAEALAREAIATYEKLYGPHHVDIANVLTTLGQIAAGSGRLAEAEQLYRRSIAIMESTLGFNHADLQRPSNSLALLLVDLDRQCEAEPLFRRALAFANESYGAYHAESATIMNNLALLLKDTGRTEEAEAYFRRAIAIDEATLGPVHTSVARDLTNLAGLLSHSNRRLEAESAARRALAIAEEILSNFHPSIATMLNNLAEILRGEKRLDEAEGLYERAIAIDEANGCKDLASAAVHLNNLALLYLGRERFRESMTLFMRSLDLNERAFGAEHPAVALVLDNAASAMRAVSEFDKAQALEERARAIRKRSTER
jgi:tetratricopeptide (TPR) repeat protein